MNASKIMEYIWLVLVVVCMVLGVLSTIDKGIENSYPFFILSILAIAMFYLRRKRNQA